MKTVGSLVKGNAKGVAMLKDRKAELPKELNQGRCSKSNRGSTCDFGYVAYLSPLGRSGKMP